MKNLIAVFATLTMLILYDGIAYLIMALANWNWNPTNWDTFSKIVGIVWSLLWIRKCYQYEMEERAEERRATERFEKFFHKVIREQEATKNKTNG